jgi:hypothetical protein
MHHFFVAVLLLSVTARADVDVPASLAAPSEPRLGLTAAFVGEQLVHPGGQIGVEFILGRFGWLSAITAANLGGFAHSRYALENYHLLKSVRGDLLVKLGRAGEARGEVERAALLTKNSRERDLLLARARSCRLAADGDDA